MRDSRGHAERLRSSLGLSAPPIAIAFPDAVPEGVEPFEGTVPAGCSFWEHAATRTFSTTASDHALCSIGVHTHNMVEAPPTKPDELTASLQAMSGLDYFRDDEVATIPVLGRPVTHAVFGPLAGFPLDPEVVLLFAHAAQGLVLSEAVARVDG